MLTEKTDRFGHIDFLKFIGLTGIIIAHVDPPSWLMMLRSFDVPLMVILSSILGAISYEKKKNNISLKNFYINRVKRLVIPTWIFLLIYFAVCYLAFGKIFNLKYYIASFGLTRYGIGYVWVMLVYLYSALLIPLFGKIKISSKGLLCITAIYIVYEILYYFKVGTENMLIDTTFYYIIPYGFLTYLGYNYNSIKKTHKLYINFASFAVFIGLAIYYWYKTGSLQLVQIAKYPPRLYYLSFGIAVSFALVQFCEKMNLKIYNNKCIQFIAKHSMWIYLWHILVLKIYSISGLPEIWYVKLIVVYITSVVVVMAINKILDAIEKKKEIKIFAYLRG